MAAELRYIITRNICIQKTANGWFSDNSVVCHVTLLSRSCRRHLQKFSDRIQTGLPSGAFIYHDESIGFRLWFMAKYRKDTNSGTFISVGQWLRKAFYKNTGQRALLLAGAVRQNRPFRSWRCIMGNHDNAHFKMADVLRWFFCFDGIHVLCLRLAWL